METSFNDVAALLDHSLADGELYTCRFDAEVSDFVRMNRGKVRQSGTVAQRYLRLHLVHGQRHAEQCLTVAGDLGRDRDSILTALAGLRAMLGDLPEDPHLSFATEPRSSRVVRREAVPPSAQVVASVLDAAAGLDLVGLYAAGRRVPGFWPSLGQRNWHEVASFNLQWSLYHRADKAVKTAYGGFTWDDAAVATKMADATERLPLLAPPPPVPRA